MNDKNKLTNKPLVDYFGYFLRDLLETIIKKKILTTIIFDGSLDDMKKKYGSLLQAKMDQLTEAMTKNILHIYVPENPERKEKVYHFAVIDAKDLFLEELHEPYSPRRTTFIRNVKKTAIYHELIFEELLTDCYPLTVKDLFDVYRGNRK